MWDQVDAHTKFQYDNRNQVTIKTDPLLKSSTHQYYDDGHLWKKTARKGDTITYTYTPSGKLRTISYPDSTAVTFVYKGIGNY